ncbi:lysophospholipid acyltransferase family protein [Humitalea sp. 24SJ18S-53]|uniref:lysophospholipid acyltransferase family protein n=1 Tax=Humitalea sp. 24SJ18S-53 TaxID=3422307 RepID=UPI003D66A728
MDAAAAPTIDALRPRRKRKGPLRFKPVLPGSLFRDVMEPRPLGGRFRAVRRIIFVALWTLVSVPVQAVLVALPGRANHRFARTYLRVLCYLIGLRVQVVGVPPEGGAVLYAANHTSWLDILVLGAVLDARFVSKGEIANWPIVGWCSRLGGSVFVSRTRGRTGDEARAMRARLEGGESLVLFPEGTSNDGTRVLAFRSSFLSVADAAHAVQPVSLVYDRLGGLPACRRDRPLFAWYGDMDLASHFWRLMRRPGARATILLHAPIDPADYRNRKALTAAVADVVAEGASSLRQNRPPRPLAVGPDGVLAPVAQVAVAD